MHRISKMGAMFPVFSIKYDDVTEIGKIPGFPRLSEELFDSKKTITNQKKFSETNVVLLLSKNYILCCVLRFLRFLITVINQKYFSKIHYDGILSG